jgi:hypothetical protein
MTAVPGQPVVDPAEWTGAELSANRRWIFELGAEDLDALRGMAKSVRTLIGEDANKLPALPDAAFGLGTFARKASAIRHELKDGLGAALLRRLPMEDMDALEAAIIYWGIGRHLGAACSNNPEGDMLGHVTDLGKTQKDPSSRGYQTREEMAYHCDQSTLVGLLCVRTPRSGGLSKIASSVAVYNEMLRRDPRAVALLSGTFCWTKHGEKDAGERNCYESPVFNFLDGKLCTAFGPTHILKGHQLPGVPPLTQAQRDAIQLAKDIAEEQHYSITLQLGDMQFLNNLVAMHTRTEYEDWPDPQRKRLLWRLWLVAPDIRPSTPYIRQWGEGVRVSSTRERIVL